MAALLGLADSLDYPLMRIQAYAKPFSLSAIRAGKTPVISSGDITLTSGSVPYF
jgi:hypothetical protein